MTKQPREIQRNFVTMFFLLLMVDLLASIAVATSDEVLTHLSGLWFGPLDDISFGVLGIQAFLFLLDPEGSETQDPGGGHSLRKVWNHLTSGEGVARGFAERYSTGIRQVFFVLPLALTLFLIINTFNTNPVVEGVVSTGYRHLAYLFPVSLALGIGFSMLRLAENADGFWKGLLVAAVCLCVVAAIEGRWQNHFYHLFANLENLHAWMVSLAWAASFAASSGLKSPQESAPAHS